MKKFLILFGILDIVTLIRNLGFILTLTRDFTDFPAIIGLNILMYSSLVFSSYFLIKQNKVGLWVTYGQFPLRLFCLTLSFGFLLAMNRYFQLEEFGHKVFLVILIGLEVVRLIMTIQIHRNYFRGKIMPPLGEIST